MYDSILLTEERFEEILLKIYIKGQESESIRVIEIIEEIKGQILVK